MKTRRGFFAALVGALAAPLLLAKTALAKSAVVNAPLEVAQRSGEPFEFQPDTAKALNELNGALARWSQKPNKTIESDLESGVVTITEWIPVGDVAKRYPAYVLYPEPIGIKIWPDPPTWSMRYQQFPWDTANWHRFGKLPVERTVTITNPDGTTKTVTINQGA